MADPALLLLSLRLLVPLLLLLLQLQLLLLALAGAALHVSEMDSARGCHALLEDCEDGAKLLPLGSSHGYSCCYRRRGSGVGCPW